MVNDAAMAKTKKEEDKIKIIGIKQKRIENDMVLWGIDKVEEAISLYYGEADDFLRGLFFDIRHDLKNQGYYMHSFGWGTPQSFLKSTLTVRELDSTGEMLLLSFNIFDKQGIGIKIASEMGVNPALKGIVIKVYIEPNRETNRFNFEFDDIVYILRCGPLKELKMGGEDLALAFFRENHIGVEILINAEYKVIACIENVAGLLSSSDRAGQWEKSGSVISGPFCEKWEMQEINEKENPCLELRIMSSAKYRNLDLPILDEELEQKIIKIADRIEAAFSI